MLRRIDLLLPIGLVLAMLIVYVPQVDHPFIELDDDNLITENLAVQQLTPRSIRAIFTSYDPELYVPLTLLTYQIEYAIAGPTSTVFHLMNIVLHIGSTLLLLSLMRQLTGSEIVASITAALFALHPLNVESVLWASARKDVLSSFFFLLSWRQYLVYRQTEQSRSYWQSLIAFFCALLSKASIVVLPIVLLLSDWVQGRKIDRMMLQEKIPYFVLSVIFTIIAMFGKAAVLGEVSTGAKLLLFVKSSAFYLQKLVVPKGLSIIYPQTNPVAFSSSEFFAPMIVVVLLLVTAILTLKKIRWIPFGIIFFFLLLLPSAATFSKNGFLLFASDRYVYLAGIGVFVLIGLLVDRMMQRGGVIKTLTSGIAITGLLTIGIAASLQTRVWANSLTLFEHVLTHYPESVVAHNTVGVLIQRQGNWEEAEKHFEKAIEEMPTYALPYVNLAKHEEASGNIAASEAQYKRMLAALEEKEFWGSDDANAVSIYAQWLEDRGRMSEAIELYRLAATRADFVPLTHYNLGLKYQQMGQGEDAIKEFERALEIQPKSADTHYRLAALHAEAGRLQEAKRHLQEVLKLDSNHAKARQHLGAIEGMLKR